MYKYKLCSLILLSSICAAGDFREYDGYTYFFADFDTSMRCQKFSKSIIDWNYAAFKQIYYRNNFCENKLNDQPLIPKIIHQIWLGGALPDRFNQLIDSIKKLHPTWQYILWTDNKVRNLHLQNQKVFNQLSNFGAKADVLRYEILYNYGGVYIDIDFEMLKPLDIFHYSYDFYAVLFPWQSCVSNGIIASAAKHPILASCIAALHKTAIAKELTDSQIQCITGPAFFTKFCLDFIFKNPLSKTYFFPASYFFSFPGNLKNQFWSNKITRGQLQNYRQPESVALHMWANSWVK